MGLQTEAQIALKIRSANSLIESSEDVNSDHRHSALVQIAYNLDGLANAVFRAEEECRNVVA